MFDIAWSEILLIAILALVFIGPKELPDVLNNLGRSISKLRRSADDFRRQFEESMKEAGYEDLHKNLQDFRQLNPAHQIKASIERAVRDEYKPQSHMNPLEADAAHTIHTTLPASVTDQQIHEGSSGNGSLHMGDTLTTRSSSNESEANQKQYVGQSLPLPSEANNLEKVLPNSSNPSVKPASEQQAISSTIRAI